MSQYNSIDYTRLPIQYNNSYYIHLHSDKIGKLYLPSDGLDNYKKYRKEQTIDYLKNEYKRLFKENITFSQTAAIQAIGRTMDLNQDQVIQKINDAIFDKLSNLNFNKLSTIHYITNAADISSMIKSAISNNDLSSLKTLLATISYCINLLQIDNGGLGACLLKAASKKDRIKVGQELNKQLNNYYQRNKGKIVQQEIFNKIYGYLQNLGYALTEGKFKSTQSELSAQGLARLISQNIISTGLAQPTSALALLELENKTNNQIKTLKDAGIELVGTSQINHITGKTDIQDKNFSLNIAVTQGRDINLEINLGLSNKFYLQEPFKDLNSTQSQLTISSGSGGTLKQALIGAFGSSTEHQYLAYNFVSHSDTQDSVNDLVLTHSLIKLFASAGDGDFSQFIIANGSIISIWDLIQYAISTNLIESSSRNSNQAITLHIQGRKEIITANQIIQDNNFTTYKNMWVRTHKVNSMINDAKISADLHLQKFINRSMI